MMIRFLAGLVLIVFNSCGIDPAGLNNYHGDLSAQDNFEPKYKYNPLPDIAVQLFPPRIITAEGVSLSKMGTRNSGQLLWLTSHNALILECSLQFGDEKTEITMRIRNSAAFDITAKVRYPVVHYTMRNDSTLRILDPSYGGVLESRNASQQVNTWYPGVASFCATLAAGNKKVIGMALRNPEQRSTHITHMASQPVGQMTLELERITVPAGKSIELPSGYIAVGDDWGDVLKPYRDWLLNTFPANIDLPAWYENGEYVNVWQAHCVVPYYPPEAARGIWVFDPAFRTRSVEDIRREVDEGCRKAEQTGHKPLFYEFGWWRLMAAFQGLQKFDGLCGDYTGAHDLAKEAIKYIHEKGGKVFLYTNFVSAGEESRLFREHAELFARDEGGMPIRNGNYPMYLFCLGASQLKTYWDKVILFMLKDLDADGIFFDVLGGSAPNARCSNPTHDHRHNDTYGEDFLRLLAYVSNKIKAVKPDAIICSELPMDIGSMWIDQLHVFGFAQPREEIVTSPEIAARTFPNEYMVFSKFINPHARWLPGGPEEIIAGAPGLPDHQFYKANAAIFSTGPAPCHTEPVGAMAYLYGPVGGEAILVTRAATDINQVKVSIPASFQPAKGGSDVADLNENGEVIVEAGTKVRFYKLKTLTE